MKEGTKGLLDESSQKVGPNRKVAGRNATDVSKKSPTGPTERTPKKPEYLIARSQLTERGLLVRSHLTFFLNADLSKRGHATNPSA